MRWIRILLFRDADIDNAEELAKEGGCLGCLGFGVLLFYSLFYILLILPVALIALVILMTLAYFVFDSLKFW